MLDLVKTRKARLAAILATGAMSAGVLAAPASAQPFVTGGLVNVTITDVLSHDITTVTVPISAAANICGVSVGVIQNDVLNNVPVSCQAGSAATA